MDSLPLHCVNLRLARTIYIFFLRLARTIYIVCIWYFWQRLYGHKWSIYIYIRFWPTLRKLHCINNTNCPIGYTVTFEVESVVDGGL